MPARPKPPKSPDVLVVGDHPAAHLAAALAADKKARVVHLVPADRDAAGDARLVRVNPALFDLHKRLKPLRDALDLSPLHGVAFLSDDGHTAGTHAAEAPSGYVARLGPLRDAVAALADESGVDRRAVESVALTGIDPAGVHATAGGETVDAKVMVRTSDPAPADAAALGVRPWADAQLRRVTTLDLPPGAVADHDGPPVMPMSLDLGGTLLPAWLLVDRQGGKVNAAQASVVEPVAARPKPDGGTASGGAIGRWLAVLAAHGYLSGDAIDPAAATRADLPLAGALERDPVADRTLLIGPAGGFLAATGEDLYPACWSAVFAAPVAADAARADHPQDALGNFRGKWGATLGDYLRGPQQNLRFLLPLIYSNAQMTARYSDAVLLGKGVIR